MFVLVKTGKFILKFTEKSRGTRIAKQLCKRIQWRINMTSKFTVKLQRLETHSHKKIERMFLDRTDIEIYLHIDSDFIF